MDCIFQVFYAELVPPFEVRVHPFSLTDFSTRITEPHWRIGVTDCNAAWVCNNVPAGLTLAEECLVAARYADALNKWSRACGGRFCPCDGGACGREVVREDIPSPPSPFEKDYREEE